GKLNINGQCLKLAKNDSIEDASNVKVYPIEGDIYYRRRLIGDHEGNQQTQFSEIRFGHHSLTMTLYPNFEIIYSCLSEGEQ
ncbi:hypothetical protein, partial [Enterococcus faecalis]|uniref:hypothetical protein n=1 Tax=Enterococcus faecalis TaxID=1351 RepID=UPI00403F7863